MEKCKRNPLKILIMKRINLSLTILAVCLFSFSCVRDSLVDIQPEETATENEINFVIGSPSTRGGDVKSAGKARRVSIPLFKSEDDDLAFSLEEEISDMGVVGAEAIETRGIPAYSENVAALYKSFTAIVPGFATDEEKAGAQFVYGDGKWKYTTTNDLWGGDDEKELEFYMRMPDSPKGVKSDYTNNDGAITFSYESPVDAGDQEDILFTSTTLKKEERAGGHQITFYHALAGVKFRIANPSKNGITAKITNVQFTNLHYKGTCTIDPAATPKASWVVADDRKDFSQAYDKTVDFTEDDGNNFAASFYASNNTNNLNEETGELTFYFVPQTITEAVSLTVNISVTTSGRTKEYTNVINFGTLFSGAVWNAGELRTYTINANEVNLKIEDQVNETTKSNVTITNTGNTNAFIRAAIVGQWLDEEGNTVFGFTDKVNNLYLVESWYEDQFGDGDGSQGTFVGLVEYTKNGQSGQGGVNWVNGSDGYYYYTVAVEPGAQTSSLFESYTIGTVPNAQIAGLGVTIHFVLEIATQAIEAKSNVSWDEAWGIQ